MKTSASLNDAFAYCISSPDAFSCHGALGAVRFCMLGSFVTVALRAAEGATDAMMRCSQLAMCKDSRRACAGVPVFRLPFSPCACSLPFCRCRLLAPLTRSVGHARLIVSLSTLCAVSWQCKLVACSRVLLCCCSQHSRLVAPRTPQDGLPTAHLAMRSKHTCPSAADTRTVFAFAGLRRFG